MRHNRSTCSAATAQRPVFPLSWPLTHTLNAHSLHNRPMTTPQPQPVTYTHSHTDPATGKTVTERDGERQAARQTITADELHELLTEAELSGPKAAELANTSTRAMQQWMSGARAMPLPVTELFCLALLAGWFVPIDSFARLWVRADFLALLLKPPPEQGG
jgi:DNA-binding transcriptional regulator YiaG